MFFVYIIQSQKDESYYVGQAQDVRERLYRHNVGKERYTKSHRPWKLVHIERFQTRLEAIRREREIKKQKSRKVMERLIRESGA